MGLVEKMRDYFSFRGNIPPLFVSSVVEGTGWGMIDLLWQPLVLTLGGSTSIIGAFNSIWIALVSFLQLVTGEFCDSMGRKALITFYYILSVAGIGLTLMAGSWMYLLPSVIIFAVADSMGEPAFQSIFPESVDDKNVGIAFSVMSLSWWLPGFYSQLLGGFIGDTLGMRRALMISLALEVLALAIFTVYVKETLKERKSLEFGRMISSIKSSIRPQSGLSAFFAFSILDRFAWTVSGGIFVAMLYESTDLTLLQIGMLTSMTSIATTLALIPAGKMVDSYGPKGVMRVAALLSVFMFSGFIVTTGFIPFLILQAVKGLSIGLWDPAGQTYLANAVESSERGKYFGNLNSLKGVFSIPAPLVGAYLFDVYGFPGVFALSLVVSLAAFLVSFRLK